MAVKKKYAKVPLEASIHMQVLHQECHMSGNKVAKKYRRYSRATVYRHCAKKRPDSVSDGRSRNKGRPKKMTDRLKRNILRQIPFLRKKYGTNYGVKEIRKFANVSQDISNRTVRRVLYDAGFGLKSARRKGVLTEKDLKQRVQFARYAKIYGCHFIW